jgi:amino acid adenylation domain-containing protein
VVLRTDLSGNPSFRELLKRVRKVTLEAYEHQDVPYEKLLEELRPPRDLSRSALFQVMCVLHNTPQPVPTLPGLTVYPLEIDPGTTRFDMTLEFWETPDGLRSCFEYSLDLFEMATIARMAGHLQTLLESMVDDPEQRLSYLPLLTADERRRVLVEWNPTTTSYPNNQCIQDVFESQVARTPTAVAVLCGDESLTYLELNCRANQVAHYLLALGVKRETPVGLCIERSCAMIVGLLGILKAGAAYVPLDPTYPPERLTFMLEDAKPPILLTQERCLAALSSQRVQMICLDTHWPAIEQYRDDNPIIEARADSLAYILYTSGSTGKPKGVLGVHGAVLNALTWMWQTYPFASTDVCCQKTSISFGDSIQELFGPLLRGIRVVLIPDEVCKDLVRFVDLLAWHRITRIILVPSLLRILLDTFRNLENQLPSLTLWFAGGEALSVDLCQRFQSLLPHSRLINLYGTSEASDDTTWYDTSSVASEKSYVPIGRPIANTQVYVLDYQLQPVPMGVPGELYVGGAGLARGYLNRPALTAERFIPHPFSCEPGARLFKTGDIVRYLADGNIEYIGRSDQQVKLLGVRIELGEIESALMQHPCIRETAVIVHEDASGELRLVAYVIPAQEPGPSLRELRHFLAKQLPASMVPTAFIMLDALPQTPSGKVDRQALPQPTLLRPSLEDRYVAPSTSNEKRVVAVWRQILGLERVGIHDNFFELGGHSLLAMQLLFRIRDATSVEIPLLRFFENPTVSSMVSIIEAANQPEQGVQVPVIGPVSRDGTLLASIAQEHFWLFDQVLPSLPLFNIPYTVRLRGVLNIAILEQSFNEIIKHHEALRTTFATENGQLIQVIAPKLSIFLPVSDLRAVPDARREDEAQRLVQEEGQRPFDLEHGSLLRGCLLRLGEQEHILLVVLHHIICDGWSLGVLMRALADVYDAFAAGQPSPLATLPIQYADFAAWQRQFHTNTQMQSQLTYWRAQLQEPVPVLALPTDYPQSTSLAFDTAHQNFKITATLFEALTDLSQREGCTLFMTCLAAVKILLYGYTSQEDLCIATLVANRTRPETEALIGLLVNTVLLRTDLSGNPSQREVLRRVRATTMAAFAHQDLPFEEVIRALEQERDFERASLCQVMVIWHNEMIPTDKLPQRAICFEAIEQNVGGPIAAPTTFDIILILRERTEGLTGTVICKTDLFKAETISRILDDFQYVLTCLHTQPEKTLATFHSLRQVCY